MRRVLPAKDVDGAGPSRQAVAVAARRGLPRGGDAQVGPRRGVGIELVEVAVEEACVRGAARARSATRVCPLPPGFDLRIAALSSKRTRQHRHWCARIAILDSSHQHHGDYWIPTLLYRKHWSQVAASPRRQARLRRDPLGDGPRELPILGAHGREACRPAAARRALPRLETRARVDEVRLCVPSQPAGPRSEVRFFLWNRSVTALESGPSMPV